MHIIKLLDIFYSFVSYFKIVSRRQNCVSVFRQKACSLGRIDKDVSEAVLIGSNELAFVFPKHSL
jgi:hypothetical protein